MTALALLATRWREALIALLLVALMIVCSLYASKLKAARTTLNEVTASYNLEVSKHAITSQSLAECTGKIDVQNGDVAKRADTLAAVKAGDAADQKRLDALYAQGRGMREAVDAVAKAAAVPGGCRVPSALAAAVEGL